MNIKPNIIKDIDIEWLKKAALKISSGETTLAKKCQDAKFIVNHSITICYPISENSLRRLFRHYNIKYEAKKGPEKKPIPDIVEINIIRFYHMLRCGETITYLSMRASNHKVTQYQVQKVFKKYNFYKYVKEKNDPKDRCTYLAKYTNQIWHSDIHYLEKNDLYLYAIIDDRSRFIVGHGVLVEKSAIECKKVLKEAVIKHGKPAIIWTDNGGENTGDKMKDYLREARIYPVFITPHNPEQNGKIEAWWKKLDDYITCIEEIPQYIEVYNTLKVHTRLEKGPNGVYKRPADVYLDESLKWKRDYKWTWYVNGKEVNFKINEERKREYYD